MEKKKKAPVKRKPAPKKEAVKIDPNKIYDFVVDKDTKHMKKGTYTVDGVMAQVLTDKGLGSVKA
jgi:hypothetical protein